MNACIKVILDTFDSTRSGVLFKSDARLFVDKVVRKLKGGG